MPVQIREKSGVSYEVEGTDIACLRRMMLGIEVAVAAWVILMILRIDLVN
jgi:hypothetical protein